MLKGPLLLGLSLFGYATAQLSCQKGQFATGLQVDLSECVTPKTAAVLPASEKFTITWDFETSTKCSAIWKQITAYTDLQQLSFGYQGCKTAIYNPLTEPFKAPKGTLVSLEEACRGCSPTLDKEFGLYLAGGFGGNKVLYMGFTNVKLSYSNSPAPSPAPTPTTTGPISGNGGSGKSIIGGTPTLTAPSVFGTATSDAGAIKKYQFGIWSGVGAILILNNFQ